MHALRRVTYDRGFRAEKLSRSVMVEFLRLWLDKHQVNLPMPIADTLVPVVIFQPGVVAARAWRPSGTRNGFRSASAVVPPPAKMVIEAPLPSAIETAPAAAVA